MAAPPMSQWKCGFAHSWIEWDGVEGLGHEAGTVLVDGRRVPTTATACDVAPRSERDMSLETQAVGVHQPLHDHCYTVMGDTAWSRAHNCVGHHSEPPGFSFGFHLENGVMARAMVDDESSAVLIEQAWDSDNLAAVDLRHDPHTDADYLEICGTVGCCVDRETGAEKPTNHMGTSIQFESWEELMAIIDRLSRLEVRREVIVRPARPRPPEQRPEADEYGAITLEEWQRRQVTP